MVSEKVAPVLLAKTLTSFDLVVIFVGIVLFIVNSAGFQFAGPRAFVYPILAYLTFLIPGAFVTAQLGRMFPEEGSIYSGPTRRWAHSGVSSPGSSRGGPGLSRWCSRRSSWSPSPRACGATC